MEEEKKASGALIGLVVIIILLVVGGIYIWQLNKKELQNMKATPEAANVEDSDALNALEQEINTTDTNVGVDLNTVN